MNTQSSQATLSPARPQAANAATNAAPSATAASAAAAAANPAANTAGAPAPTQAGVLRVARKRIVADGVAEFTLVAPDGSRLPDWAPGAHIDVTTPGEGNGETSETSGGKDAEQGGLTRQYSLSGDRWNAHEYRIMVQREADGRGGSAALHDRVNEGDLLPFGGPRNNFRMPPAAEYLFIAGGIGITPMLPMIDQARRLGAPWRLVYLGSSAARLAGLAELEALAADAAQQAELGQQNSVPDQPAPSNTTPAQAASRVEVHAADERGCRADLEAWRPTDPAVRVLACGPTRLLDAVEAWGAVPGGVAPRVERFTAQTDDDGPRRAFTVVASRSGAETEVAPGESVVTALKRCGVDVITSCAQGVCGTCETGVLEGDPDHRDSLLDDAERAIGDCLFPCVSRSRSARLVLDV